MNIYIQKFKKGSGIHIKKSHEGLFTQYCNGKVTSECTANARKWKHRLGGKVVENFKLNRQIINNLNNIINN